MAKLQGRFLSICDVIIAHKEDIDAQELYLFSEYVIETPVHQLYCEAKQFISAFKEYSKSDQGKLLFSTLSIPRSVDGIEDIKYIMDLIITKRKELHVGNVMLC